MSRCAQRGRGSALALALVLGALAAAGCRTVREELQPVRETTLTVARAGGEVTLSWIAERGRYYSVMYTEERGARAQWRPLPEAINLRAAASGESIVVHDRLPAARPRYYRLVQDAKPLLP